MPPRATAKPSSTGSGCCRSSRPRTTARSISRWPKQAEAAKLYAEATVLYGRCLALDPIGLGGGVQPRQLLPRAGRRRRGRRPPMRWPSRSTRASSRRGSTMRRCCADEGKIDAARQHLQPRHRDRRRTMPTRSTISRRSNSTLDDLTRRGAGGRAISSSTRTSTGRGPRRAASPSSISTRASRPAEMTTNFLFDGPEDARVTIMLAHGAGAPMDSASMNATTKALAAAGFRVARFEFGYMAARRTRRAQAAAEGRER